MMDIRQLRRFVAVVDLGSFNRAADALAVSQPSLTRSVQQLEEAVGGALFERGPGGTALTTTGEELLPHARLILRERDRTIAAMLRLRDRHRHVQVDIGTDATFARRILPRAMWYDREDSERAGEGAIQFRVREGSLDDMLDALRQGELRFVLAARPASADLTDLVFEPWLTERASIVMRRGHPLAAARDLPAFVGAAWIVPDHPSLVEGWSAMFRHHDLPVPPIALQTSSVSLMRSCLFEGDYVVLGDHTPFADDVAAARLVFADLPKIRYERPTGLFRRQEMRLTAHESRFVNQLRLAASG